MKNKETLEEAIERIPREIDFSEFDEASFNLGVNWQQERMYNEKDMFDAWKASHTGGLSDESLKVHFNIWFEQFKKK